jgi:hypothetical protein
MCPVRDNKLSMATIFFSVALVLFFAQPRSIKIGVVPLQAILVWIAFLMALVSGRMMFIRRIRSVPLTVRTAVVVLLVFVLVRSFLDGWHLLRAGQLITGILIALLTLMVNDNARERRAVLVVISVAASMSGLIAILQSYLDIPFLWRMTSYEDVGFVYGAAGLEANPVPFVFSILGIGTVLLIHLMYSKIFGFKIIEIRSGLAVVAALITTWGLIASRSRSGLMGMSVAIAVGIVPLFVKRKRRLPYQQTRRNLSLLFLLVISASVLAITFYTFNIRNVQPLRDPRIKATWSVYLPIVLKNPFGISSGADRIEAIDAHGTSRWVTYLEGPSGQIISPHNFFLSTSFSYGLVAGLSLLFIYITLIFRGYKRFVSLWKAGDLRSSLYIMLMLTANIAIIMHSSFHNANIALGEMRNWLWVGFLSGSMTANHTFLMKVRKLRRF